jgi:hypothetical protein
VVRGPVRQRIVDLVAGRPDGLTRRELIEFIYAADPNGGPNNENTISVTIRNANKELKEQGYYIAPAWRGRGARYRLFKIDSVRGQP